MSIDKTLRLYFESGVRLANGQNPATMTDEELVAVVGLLPAFGVSYSEWQERIGIGEEQPQPQRRAPTVEEGYAINKAAEESERLYRLGKAKQ